MEHPVKDEDSTEREKTPEQAATMKEYCALEMKKLEQQLAQEAMFKTLRHTSKLDQPMILVGSPIESSPPLIPSDQKVSFLEAFMNANCSLQKKADGTLSIRFQNWLNACQWHELSMKEVDVIMREAKRNILEEWKTKVVPGWQVFNQSSPEVSDEQKYFAMVYLYRNFIHGYHLKDTLSSQCQPSPELAQVRKQHQRALEAGNEKDFNACNRFRLHPEDYTFFYTREMKYRGH